MDSSRMFTVNKNSKKQPSTKAHQTKSKYGHGAYEKQDKTVQKIKAETKKEAAGGYKTKEARRREAVQKHKASEKE